MPASSYDRSVALVRPSELARTWELHPRTVLGWIKDGRLPAIKTPGAQYRLREGDVRTFCEKNGLPLPRALATTGATIAFIGKTGPQSKALVRACRASTITLRLHATPLEGVLAVATEVPAVIVFDAGTTPDLLATIHALRKSPRTQTIPIVVLDVPRAPRGRTTASSPRLVGPSALAKAGATRVFMRADPDDDPMEAVLAFVTSR